MYNFAFNNLSLNSHHSSSLKSFSASTLKLCYLRVVLRPAALSRNLLEMQNREPHPRTRIYIFNKNHPHHLPRFVWRLNLRSPASGLLERICTLRVYFSGPCLYLSLLVFRLKSLKSILETPNFKTRSTDKQTRKKY